MACLGYEGLVDVLVCWKEKRMAKMVVSGLAGLGVFLWGFGGRTKVRMWTIRF